jgi:preprotein translocase subunit SecG
VKVFLIVTAAVVLLLIILLLTSGGHGPGRHMSGDAFGGPAEASEVVRTVEVTTLGTFPSSRAM